MKRFITKSTKLDRQSTIDLQFGSLRRYTPDLQNGQRLALALHRLIRRQGRFLLGLGTVVVLLALWEFLSRIGAISLFALPPPTRIVRAIYQLATFGFPNDIGVFSHIKMTVVRILQGYTLGSVAAIPLGLIIGRISFSRGR